MTRYQVIFLVIFSILSANVYATATITVTTAASVTPTPSPTPIATKTPVPSKRLRASRDVIDELAAGGADSTGSNGIATPTDSQHVDSNSSGEEPSSVDETPVDRIEGSGTGMTVEDENRGIIEDHDTAGVVDSETPSHASSPPTADTTEKPSSGGSSEETNQNQAKTSSSASTKHGELVTGSIIGAVLAGCCIAGVFHLKRRHTLKKEALQAPKRSTVQRFQPHGGVQASNCFDEFRDTLV